MIYQKDRLSDDIDNKEIILNNILNIRKKIDLAAISSQRSLGDIRLMAITKTVSPENVNVAIASGIDLIGENRVQEYLSKKTEYLPTEVHFVGTLQKNKVKHIINDVTMIHSVSDISLANEIDNQANKNNKIMDFLIEVNIGKEPNKTGVFPEYLIEFAEKTLSFNNIRLRGLMVIPPVSENKNVTRIYFAKIRQYLVDIQFKIKDNNIDTLSMGMSDDFELAIEQGANIIRIGSSIFGRR